MPVHALSEVDTAATALRSCRLSAAVDDRWRLADGRVARLATGCLLRPLAGDLVLVADTPEGAFVVQVLDRADGQTADLSVPGAARLRIGQRRLELNASDAMALRALRDLDLESATGSLSLSGRNLVLTALDSLLEQVRQRIGLADEICMRAKRLFRLHGGDAFVTADKDVRIDGERINVG